VLLEGQGADDLAVVSRLQEARRAAFGAKFRFNRVLRTLVGWPMGVRLGAVGASLAPAVLRHVIATAGDAARDRRGASAA